MKHTYNDFDIFLTHWKTGRPNRQADWITVKVGKGTAKKCAEDANKLIEAKELNLTAIPSPFGDSFLVQASDCEF